MAVETEIKLRVDSHTPVRQRLRELGAEPLGTVIEHNVILDRPDGSLRSQGCGLRLRSYPGTASGRAVLTYKGPVRPGPMKSREEIEVSIEDGERGSELLRSVGFVPVLTYEKRRESWTIRGCRVELDEPPAIGLFVEIEGADESTIRQVQQELELERQPTVRDSYVRLLADYCERHGIMPRELRLGLRAE